MRQTEKNRLEAGVATETVKTSIEEHLTYLDKQIGPAREQIKAHIGRHPTLKHQRDLLVCIPGISDTTAAAVLAELGDVLQFCGARQVHRCVDVVAALAGVVPRLRESGQMKGHVCLSKVGSSRLGKALYMPAMVAVRFNPAIAALSERLLSRGKSKMAILGAAMRKLLHIVYGVLKSGQPFDASVTSARPAAVADAL